MKNRIELKIDIGIENCSLADTRELMLLLEKQHDIGDEDYEEKWVSNCALVNIVLSRIEEHLKNYEEIETAIMGDTSDNIKLTEYDFTYNPECGVWKSKINDTEITIALTDGNCECLIFNEELGINKSIEKVIVPSLTEELMLNLAVHEVNEYLRKLADAL